MMIIFQLLWPVADKMEEWLLEDKLDMETSY